MSETYCGKSCDSCSYKISEQCPGCSEGPGNEDYGACDLAKCCRDKGHEKCETCRFSYDCYLLKDKEYMPEEMAKKTKLELNRRDKLENNVPILAFWLKVLLWLNVPSFVGGLLATQSGSEEIALLGLFISLFVELIYGVILIKLATVEKRFAYSGIFFLLSTGLSGFSLFIPSSMKIPSLIISMVSTVLSTAATYYEIYGYASVLRGVDNVLSAKWIKVWKWNLIMIVALFGGTFVAVAIPSLGALMILASSFIAIAVSVLKIWYTFETMKVFKSYQI